MLWRAKRRDRALRDFLDLFNHRLLSLFYRAWEKHRFPIVYERSGARGGGLFEHMLFAVVGLGTRGLRNRLSVSDLGLLRWASMLSRRPASETEVEDWVRDFFGVDAEVTSFVPAWYVVEDDERLLLGRGTRLGRDAFLGGSVLVAQSRFAIRIGPLAQAQYAAFLPGGPCFRALGEMLRMLVGPEYDFEIRLRLHRGEVPSLRLRGPDTPGAKLGWTTWLLTRPLARDPEDVVISGDRALAWAH
jgi:type VI secretion system protein ImpH